MDENGPRSPPRVSECPVAGTLEQAPPDSGAVCEIPGRSEGSYGEDFVNELCNGDDIMVEVSGSAVYVGGVCTSESGQCSDGNAGEMYLNHGERVEDDGVISGRHENRSGDEDCGTADGLESRDAGISGMGSTGIRNEMADEMEELAVDEAVMEDAEEGNELGVARSTGGETGVNCCTGVDLFTEEVAVEGHMKEIEEITVGELVSGCGDRSHERCKLEIEALDQAEPAPETRSDDAVGAVEDSVMASAELAKGLPSDSAEDDTELVDGGTVNASTESKTENFGASEVAGSSCDETQGHEESSLGVNHNEEGDVAVAGVDLFTKEVAAEGQMKEMEESTGDELVLGCGDGSHERSKLEIEALNQAEPRPEIRREDAVDACEDSTTASAELANGLASDSAEDDTKLVDGTVNAARESKTKTFDASNVAGNSSDETLAHEESSSGVNHNEKGDVAVAGEGGRSNGGGFSVPDLVWGKVKSHPWWPGQVFDFTDASEKAMKHHKKDCYLVAYFGDRSFAWNEASTLKSFRTHFSEMVAQSNGETFHNAVSCALEELSRRVELGLACSCTPKDSLDEIQFQIVENAGIRSESSRRDEVDESAGVSSFQTDTLMEFVKQLAQSPSGGGDHLGLAIAKAQLLAFSRFKGFCSLPEIQFCRELVETDTVDDFDQRGSLSKDDEQVSSSHEISQVPNRFSHKRKHNLKDSAYPKSKEKSMSELMGDSLDYPDEDNFSGKKRKSGGDDDPTSHDGRKTTSFAKVCTPPKQSFKIGECIRRVASQLTGSPTVKGSIQKPDEFDIFLQGSEVKAPGPTEYSSLDELLLQLQYIAQDPLKAYSSSKVIVNFFSDFRNSVIRVNHSSGTQLVAGEKVGAKRKKESPETFEFDDMNDTYWTDRVIQNGAEEQQPQPPPQPPRRKYKKKDKELAVIRPQKTPKEGRRPYNRKQYSNGDIAVTPQKPPGYISENAPAELIMNFSDVRSVPSETNLNKMFRRFGALKETETEVDTEISRARVVFKKSSDAEVAFNSAGKFNIFGQALVTYQLSYTPILQYKPSPVIITHDHDMQLALSTHDHEMQLDLSVHDHEMHFDLPAHDHEMHLDLSNLSEFDVNLV